MTFIKDRTWAKYKDIINKFVDTDAGKQKFLWLRKIDQPSAFAEDSSPVYVPITLEGLFHYNYIKSWANNRLRDTVSGELQYDDQVLYITANQLKDLGYLTPAGYWDFNWAEDRFIVNGKVLQPGGDTQVAQAKDEALLFFVVLQRMSPEETEKLLKAYTPNGIIEDLLNQDNSTTGDPIPVDPQEP